MLVRERDATNRQTQPDGWVALVSGGQYLRDDWIRVELAGVEHAVERTAGSPALAAAAHCGVRRHYAQSLGIGCQEAAGRMFWLTRKRFSGSYFAFTAARRS